MNPRCYEPEMKDQEKKDPNMMMNECMMQPIYECPETRVCDRYIMHEVPHVMPVHTKIINHHIFKHTYTPCFTCEECDMVENVYEPICKNF